MRDTVRYALPYWPLGEVAHPLVARDLAAIFDYRATGGGRADHSTVSVPTMPAARWPPTGQ